MLIPRSLYKERMSDINNAAQPDWRQLCQIALFETNPIKLLARIADARSAILEHTKHCSKEERATLRDALATLDCWRRITERQNGYQSKAS